MQGDERGLEEPRYPDPFAEGEGRKIKSLREGKGGGSEEGRKIAKRKNAILGCRPNCLSVVGGNS